QPARKVAELLLADSPANGTLARQSKAGARYRSPRAVWAGEGDFDPRACISVLRARLRRSIHSPLSTLRARPGGARGRPGQTVVNQKREPVGTKRSERASKTSASSAAKKPASKAKPAEAKSSEVKAARL